MNKKILITASIFGLISVILGAFAAHGLEKIIDKNPGGESTKLH